MDETSLRLWKVKEERYVAIKDLSNQLTGHYTVARVLLDKYVIISFQVKYRVLRIILVHMK